MLTLKEYDDLRMAVQQKVIGWGYAKIALELFDELAAIDLKEAALQTKNGNLKAQVLDLQYKGIPLNVQTAEWCAPKEREPAIGYPYYVCNDHRRLDGATWRYCIAGKAMWDGQVWRNVYSGEPWNEVVTYYLLVGPKLETPVAPKPITNETGIDVGNLTIFGM